MFLEFVSQELGNRKLNERLWIISVNKVEGMSISENFDLAIQAKEKMSICYEEISKLSQSDAISQELVNLSGEELDHRNLLITGKNYLMEAPEVFSLTKERLTELKIVLNRTIRLIDNVRNRSISFKEAINDIVDLERYFEQFHLRSIAEIEDNSLKRINRPKRHPGGKAYWRGGLSCPCNSK